MAISNISDACLPLAGGTMTGQVIFADRVGNAPGAAFGDGTHGFYHAGSNLLGYWNQGAVRAKISGSGFDGTPTYGARIQGGRAADGVAPCYSIDKSDSGTGVGGDHSVAGQVILWSSSNKALFVEPSGYGAPKRDADITGTEFTMTSNIMQISATAGAVSIATIAGAPANGCLLTLIFTDANVTLSDNNTGASNTLDLGGDISSADDKVVQLVHDGTSWFRVSAAATN